MLALRPRHDFRGAIDAARHPAGGSARGGGSQAGHLRPHARYPILVVFCDNIRLDESSINRMVRIPACGEQLPKARVAQVTMPLTFGTRLPIIRAQSGHPRCGCRAEGGPGHRRKDWEGGTRTAPERGV